MELYKKTSLSQLWSAGISEQQIEGLDILILPENANANIDEQFDAQDSITLSKLLKQKGIKCANSYDLGLELSTKVRRSNDIWFGQIYIFNDFVLPIVTGVIGSVLATSIMERKNRKDLREPAGNVHTDIVIIKPEGKTEIHYNGDPETLVKILEILENKTNDIQN